MKRLAVMQGRLLPPRNGRLQSFPGPEWPREFALAEDLGLAAIELIVDGTSDSSNPVLTEDGRRTLRKLASTHGVYTRSVCGDILMETPLATQPARASQSLEELLGCCADLGCTRLVVPMVDEARLQDAGHVAEAIAVLEDALERAEHLGVELHLETDLPPRDFAAMLERLPSRYVRVNYDTGNSAALGYLPYEEVGCYGDRIGSVHLKDRRRGGPSVPLGEGDADLDAVLDLLAQVGYSGDFVLQVARGRDGDEQAWIAKQMRTVQDLLGTHGLL